LDSLRWRAQALIPERAQLAQPDGERQCVGDWYGIRRGPHDADPLSFQDGLLTPSSPKAWLTGNFDDNALIGNADLLTFQDRLNAFRAHELLVMRGSNRA
jgi:hypothetical protein